jgi:hypothetical protein
MKLPAEFFVSVWFARNSEPGGFLIKTIWQPNSIPSARRVIEPLQMGRYRSDFSRQGICPLNPSIEGVELRLNWLCRVHSEWNRDEFSGVLSVIGLLLSGVLANFLLTKQG